MPDVFVSPNPTTEETSPSGTPSPERSIISPLTENHIHALSSFCQNPVGVSFRSQEEEESILLFLRKHFITNVPWIFTAVIFLLVPLTISALVNFGNSPLTFLPSPFITILLLFYYLIVIGYIFVQFITWYFNISLVTKKRVIDIDFSDVVYKNVAETKLSLVQDVNYSQVGVIPSLFDYGDIIVHTAGNNQNFDFLEVPKPGRATSIIEALIGRNRPSV